jgi:hypothetical protein
MALNDCGMFSETGSTQRFVEMPPRDCSHAGGVSIGPWVCLGRPPNFAPASPRRGSQIFIFPHANAGHAPPARILRRRGAALDGTPQCVHGQFLHVLARRMSGEVCVRSSIAPLRILPQVRGASPLILAWLPILHCRRPAPRSPQNRQQSPQTCLRWGAPLGATRRYPRARQIGCSGGRDGEIARLRFENSDPPATPTKGGVWGCEPPGGVELGGDLEVFPTRRAEPCHAPTAPGMVWGGGATAGGGVGVCFRGGIFGSASGDVVLPQP